MTWSTPEKSRCGVDVRVTLAVDTQWNLIHCCMELWVMWNYGSFPLAEHTCHFGLGGVGGGGAGWLLGLAKRGFSVMSRDTALSVSDSD